MTTTNLKKLYHQTIEKLVKSKEFPNIMACPKIVKVTVNVGVAKYRKEENKIQGVIADLSKITGQKPQLTRVRKSIAGFSVRKGEIVGVMVTLRKDKMYDFLWRLFNIALPRTRDFKGISLKSVDKNGNLTIGIKEHTVFPEIKGEEVRHIFGMEVCINIKAKSKQDAIRLYKELKFPFQH